jgi:UDP-3-O-[3-hydroxymyristoyl] N-acetylglucosamine deacetylase/3-hydroxyacyl-[acyl-carrier-protein] dehydratase
MSGSSLHTGETVTLTIHPAPAGHGRKFQRRDLPDQPILDAKIDSVKTVERSTTIAEGSMKVQTVEHVLSALAGMGVDNALIEMDANEPPIGDGSAKPYVELIKKAGIAEQPVPRAVYEITEPIHLQTKSGSLMTIVPDPGFRVSCTQVGPEGRFTQFYSTEITPALYEKEIAPARTFVFYEDVKPLMDKGLIKGGSLENAVVVRGESVRFREEFARHKILDIVGDLALFGRAIRGHVIAVKPGHGPNTELARAILKQFTRTMSLVPPSVTPKGGDVLDVIDVMKLLPHRYPFLMVDRVVAIEGVGDGKRAIFPGAFSRPADHARRAAARGDGAGRHGAADARDRKQRPYWLLHERGRGEVPQAGGPRRHAFHRGGDDAAEAERLQVPRPLLRK